MGEKSDKLRAQVLASMQGYCACQERCTDDVRKRLLKEDLSQEDQDRVVRSLLDDGFLDDGRFAKQYVRGKINQNKWGKIKIRYHLQHKGIASAMIEEALSDFSEEDYRNMMAHELQKKTGQLRDGKTEKKAKLYRFAASRGYEPDLFLPMLKEFP